MKPYFTKYLPVIDDTYDKNDLFIFEINGEWTKPMEPLDLIGYQISDAKKVRLFLCTNIVKEGDEVYVEPDAIKIYEKGLRFVVEKIEILEPDSYRNSLIKYTAHPSLPSSVGHIRDWPADNLWKVVGEILTSGIEEYQKFTEEEIKILQLKIM